MINRLRLLRNIGQFDSVDTAANIPLAKITVVYSENGRGKTTLAAVLRSLATGDPLPISERKRLTVQNPPHVVLECSGGPPPAIFENNTWNRTMTDLLVFDDVFIDQNVHSGLAVQAYQRQNLHELILGEQAVMLSRRLQQLVERIENHNRELRAKERAIPTTDRGMLSIDQFCALPPRPDVDQEIQEAERALAAAQEQNTIRTTPHFESLILPEFDLGEIEEVLQRDLPALDAATLAGVQEHLASLGEGGEAWVANGICRITQREDGEGTELCPFCAQDLQGSPVIQHYRSYFSAAYGALNQRVSDVLGAVNQAHSGDVSAGIERAVRVVVERKQFWSRFCEIAEFTLDTAAIVRDWRSARDAVIAQLAAKQAAPLERMSLSSETRSFVASYDAHRETITTINQQLQEANRAIDVVKERAVEANLSVLADNLARLKAIKARHAPEVAVSCQDYLQEREAKVSTEQLRDQARADLEMLRTAVFPGYQTAINLYLSRFNSGFQLDSVTYANTRHGPSCTYNVVISNIPIPIGGEPAAGEPSFRNTLSSGDRNTLALAFFFASLDQNTDLANKVVVIDDPISSLDEHRALATVQEIRRLAERAAQVIVLSHSKPFLCRIWEGVDSSSRAALEVFRGDSGSSLRAWDVTQDSITEHDRRHTRLREFMTTGAGDVREVARSIRPHLEAFLRVACPENFPPATLLGPFRNVCRQRLGTPGEILDQCAIQELEELAEYANRFHHDTNLAWETENINDGELRGYVARTLRFARR